VNVWYGLFAPRGTPPRVIDKIASDVGRLLKNPETRERFSGLGVEAEGGDSARFKAYYRKDLEKWQKVVRAAGVSDIP
jgi:tripartite-type tricarboxylate transporter receptor subunit TctC